MNDALERVVGSTAAAHRRGWSLGSKFAVVALVFAIVVAALIGLVGLASAFASGVRAYVGAEGHWSKGQKDAVYYLARYADTQDPADFAKYRDAIDVPLGDRAARLELESADADRDAVTRGFIRGRNPPEDVPSLIFMYRWLREVEPFEAALRIWATGDTHILELVACAEELHAAVGAAALTPERKRELLDRIERINAQLTPLEAEFSATLAGAARGLRGIVVTGVGVAGVALLLAGLAVAFWIARGLRAGIQELHRGALRVAGGDLTHPLTVHAHDEIGELTQAFNRMVEQRREAEQALRRSNALAGSVIGTAYDAYVSMDAAGSVVDWNAQAERTFGWTRDEAIGRTLVDLIIPERYRVAHREGLARYLRTGEHRVLNQRIEISALHRSGREFPIELTIWALGEGAGQRFNAFLHDISERQRAVQRLAAQKTAAAALLAAATLEEAAPGVLQAVCEALDWSVGAIWMPEPGAGVLRCTELWRSPVREFPAFENATRHLTFAPGVGLPGRVWKSGAPAWIPDVTRDANFPRAGFASRDGLHGAFGFPIFSAGKEVLGVIEFFSREVLAPDEDLLKMMDTLGGLLGQFLGRKRAEAELAARADELARSNEELERFAYLASHDLQEPLRTVGSYTQLLIRRFAEVGDPSAPEFAGYITAAVERMRALIDGLLAYARVGRQPAAAEPSDLGALLGSALANLSEAIASSGATVQTEALPTLRVDAPQLVRVFQNLVGNALKFRGNAPPRVEIGARREGDAWVISVRDHGIGIDPQHFDRLFVLFQRLHSQDAYSGSGLGLAICKRIIERHGGRIWVENADPGTVFRFTLPVALA